MPNRRDSGQASIELVALVAIVVVVLLAAGAISAVAAPGLVNRVTTAWQRGLCVVAGQSCPTLEREPCPVLRTDRTTQAKLSIGWLRLGDDRALAIERRSDGTYRISLVEGVGAGAGLSWGRTGANASATGMLSARAGRTWTATDRASAVALVGHLRRRALPGAENLLRGAADLAGLAEAEPGVESYSLAGKSAVDAAATLGFGSIVEGGVGATRGLEIGVQIAAHRREATASITLDGRIGAFFDALPAASLPGARRRGRSATNGRQGGDARDGGDESAGSLLNPDKLSVEQEAYASGTIAFRLAPGPRVLEIELTAVAGAGDGARELHARIDPAAPGVAEALAGWRRHPTDPQALAAIGRAAAANAAVDERRYRVAASEREYGGEVGLGLSLGLTGVRGLRTASLVEQRSRPVGGLWERRLDCSLG